MTETAVLVNTLIPRIQHISKIDLQAMTRLMGTDHEDVGCDCSRKQPRMFPSSDVEAKHQYLSKAAPIKGIRVVHVLYAAFERL